MARILGGLAYPFQRRTSSRAILLPMSQNASEREEIERWKRIAVAAKVELQ